MMGTPPPPHSASLDKHEAVFAIICSYTPPACTLPIERFHSPPPRPLSPPPPFQVYPPQHLFSREGIVAPSPPPFSSLVVAKQPPPIERPRRVRWRDSAELVTRHEYPPIRELPETSLSESCDLGAGASSPPPELPGRRRQSWVPLQEAIRQELDALETSAEGGGMMEELETDDGGIGKVDGTTPSSEKRTLPLSSATLVLVPFVACLVAALTLLLVVLLSPALGRSRGLRTMGILEFKTTKENVSVVLGPLGACYRLTNDTPSSLPNYNCTKPTPTPFFAPLYTSLGLSPTSPSSPLPLSFPLFPTALLISTLLLSLSILTSIGLTFPQRHRTSSTDRPTQHAKTLLSIAGGFLVAAFVLEAVATSAQFATLGPYRDVVEGTSSFGVERVALGRAWGLLWAAWGLVGGTIVVGGVGAQIVFRRGEGAHTVGEEGAKKG
ncbi:hypothetical protein JCM5296_004192 [Sporobolomyces johnsonii]